MSHSLTIKDLSLYVLGYARLRRRQTNGSVSNEELRGIYGLGDFLVLMAQVDEDTYVTTRRSLLEENDPRGTSNVGRRKSTGVTDSGLSLYTP